MDWMLITIVVLLILSLTWFVIEQRRDARKDREIFDEYLRKQEKFSFGRRNRRVKKLQ